MGHINNNLTGDDDIARERQSSAQVNVCSTEMLCLHAANYDIWCKDLDSHHTSTEQTCGRTEQNGKVCLTSHTRTERPTSGVQSKWWRDDLDKYWSNMIWQRTAQDRLTWRQHGEAFAQPWTLQLPNDDDESLMTVLRRGTICAVDESHCRHDMVMLIVKHDNTISYFCLNLFGHCQPDLL